MLKNFLSRNNIPYQWIALCLLLCFDVFSQSNVKTESSNFVGSSNQFAEDFLLANYVEGENICFSPLALSSMLGWLQMGATGQTKAELQKILHYPNEDKLNSGLSSLMDRMSESDEVELSNALWIQEGLPIKDIFIHESRNLNAHVQNVDFSKSEQTTTLINQYLSDQTHDMISNLIRPDFINKNTLLALTNTVYFRDNWDEKFDVQNSFKSDFYYETNINTKADFMKKENKSCSFFGNEDYIGISLPFENQELSLLFIIPQNKNESILNLLSHMDFETLSNQVQDSYPKKFKEIVIPKFKSAHEIDLKKALMDMGLILPFTSDAEFDKINKGLFIDKGLHKTIIEVTEDGAEIASASSVIMRRSMGSSFILNRPFFYTLYNKKEELFIIVGVFNKPE